MKLKPGDWGFKISGDTSEIEIHVPDRQVFSPDELTGVAVGLMRFCAAIGNILDFMYVDVPKDN